MVVLEPGEAVDSARVKEQCGAFAIAALHYQVEQWREAGRPERHPPFDFWDDYVALLDAVDPDVAAPAHPPGPQLLGRARRRSSS